MLPLAFGSTAVSYPLDLQLFVERLTTRSVLTDEEKLAVMSLPTRSVAVKAKTDFVHENDEISYSCYVATGMVGRYGQNDQGERQITAFHMPGDMVDLHSVVRPIGVGGLNALCDTTILRVPHDAIRRLAARYPALAEAFWRDCMLDAAILNQWTVNVGRRDARTRLAHILCEMSIRSGGDREVLMAFEFPVTQLQLAEATALTSVHVNRVVKTLEREKLVTLSRGGVQIHDWDGLAVVGEFEAAYLAADTGPDRQKRLLAEA
jgi:CRP-like cAMP-binding protein